MDLLGPPVSFRLLCKPISEHSSSSSATALLQNCDLPPPLKLFTPIPAEQRMIRAFSPRSPHQDGGGPSLLRALQLSQTRAREAEEAALRMRTRNKQMAALLLEESMRLFAHRQWVRLLEVEISMLRERSMRSEKEEVRDGDGDDGDGVVSAAAWCLALAVCLGFVFGRCLF